MWGALTLAGLLGCAVTLAGFLGQFYWFLDLFAHFRVQYALGLSIIALLFVLGKRFRWAALCGAFALANIVVVVSLYVGNLPVVPETATKARALLLNVNTQQGNPEEVRALVVEMDPDIIVLEEISSSWIKALQAFSATYPHALTCPREDNFGIGLFSKHPLVDAEVVYAGSAAVPSIVATIEIEGRQLGVLATHPLPPIGSTRARLRDEQLRTLPQYLPSVGPLILLGDLNATPWSAPFKELIERSGLSNSAQGYGIQATWPTTAPTLQIPLDHCLHSPDVMIVHRETGPSAGSDHKSLIIDFAF